MILDLFRLDGRAALVTGAARGLGRAIAEGMAEAGADVALLDRLSVEETAAGVERSGMRSHRIAVDLESLAAPAAQALIRECAETLGRLDILVNAAGIIRRARAEEYPSEDWNALLQVNLSAAFYLSQAAGRYWLAGKRGGKVINVCSMLSFQGGVNASAYAAAKSGLAGLTRALASEWAPHNILVNALAPGYFQTELTVGLQSDPERAADILQRIPAGRWGQPADLQGAAVFLASPASEYVTGVILPVDGGWLAG